MRFADRILASCSAAALAVVFTMSFVSSHANAAQPQGREARPAVSKPAVGKPVATKPVVTKVRAAAPASKSGNIKSGKLLAASAAQSWGGISCVPFARAATGMDVKGNAHAWWNAAAGTYERGQRPEAGSVLNFRSTARMKLGHVAVVAQVIDSRTVEIDHANWPGPGGGKGRVARGVPVIDVSPANDWSSVQVGLSGGGFGSVYPTFGFIYDRPDRGVMVANSLAKPGALPYSEVADAWSTRVTPAWSSASMVDAPARALR